MTDSDSSSNSDPLFEETTVNGLTMDHRVGLAPMTRVSATEDGRATEQMARYYGKFARGGFSFLLTEGTYPDAEYSQGYANQPGLATDDQAESWSRVVDTVHEYDAPILAQLMHAGPLVQQNRFSSESVGPSAVKPKGEQLELYGGSGDFRTPRRLSTDELDDIEAGFVAAAERARDAGFDGVEIHGANGYLLDAFLTEYTNRRDDEYGGSPENRVRFPARVVDAVQSTLPDDFVVGIRLSQTKVNDQDYRWPGGEDEAEVVFGALSEAGADYLHVTEGDISEPASGASGPTLAELAARHGDVPVIANGGLEDPDRARAAVDAGADLVTLATGALADPDWPNRVAAGESLTDSDLDRQLDPDASLDDSEAPPDIDVGDASAQPE